MKCVHVRLLYSDYIFRPVSASFLEDLLCQPAGRAPRRLTAGERGRKKNRRCSAERGGRRRRKKMMKRRRMKRNRVQLPRMMEKQKLSAK